MGLFGGSKSKQSSNVVSGEVANYGAGPTTTLAGISGSTVNLTMGDYGAIDGGLSLARQVIDSNSGIVSSALEKTLSIASKNQVSESVQQQDTMVKLALIAGAAFALFAYLRGRRS